jgi:hypothetical protein
MNVCRAIRNFRLDADEATGHMSAIETKSTIASENGGNLLLDWEQIGVDCNRRPIQVASPIR